MRDILLDIAVESVATERDAFYALNGEGKVKVFVVPAAKLGSTNDSIEIHEVSSVSDFVA